MPTCKTKLFLNFPNNDSNKFLTTLVLKKETNLPNKWQDEKSRKNGENVSCKIFILKCFPSAFVEKTFKTLRSEKWHAKYLGAAKSFDGKFPSIYKFCCQCSRNFCLKFLLRTLGRMHEGFSFKV